MREAMMRTMKPFDCRRRRELALIGAAVGAMGLVTSNSARAADLDVSPGYPGGYQEQPYPYPYHPYPPHVQNYPLYQGPPIYYPRPHYYRPYAWAEPDAGYRYGRPAYFYSPYVDRPPAPVPYVAGPRNLPPPDDMLAEESPGYGWQPPPGW
jgi:hypothetical protein